MDAPIVIIRESVMCLTDGGGVPKTSNAIGKPLVKSHLFFAGRWLHGRILQCSSQ